MRPALFYLQGVIIITLSALITSVDTIRPNTFTAAQKTAWINEVENLIQLNIMLLPKPTVIEYEYTTDANTELIAPLQFCKVYKFYLATMIDYANEEFDVYNNDNAMFNQAFDEYSAWYAERYSPADHKRRTLPVFTIIRGADAVFTFDNLPQELEQYYIYIQQGGENILSYDNTDSNVEYDADNNAISVAISQSDSLTLDAGVAVISLIVIDADGLRYESNPCGRLKIRETANGEVIE